MSDWIEHWIIGNNFTNGVAWTLIAQGIWHWWKDRRAARTEPKET